MRNRGSLVVIALLLAAPATRAQPPITSAKVEIVPLELRSPERYQVPLVLEPIRRVAIAAPFDGLLRSQEGGVGYTIKENQELAQFDRTEAAAKLKIAQAVVKEARAGVGSGKPSQAYAEARVDEALARQELAQLELDRCTVRAPFTGRLLAIAVSSGQFLLKGEKVAELADVSSLRVLVPLERGGAAVGAAVTLSVEGQAVAGKVQAIVPLPESLAVLHELATSYLGAWVIVPNAKGNLEPGLRVQSPALPADPVAIVPARSLHDQEKGAGTIQVIRNEYVTDVRARVLGVLAGDRVQVSAAFRPNDTLILSSTAPLHAGSLLRFEQAARGVIEGVSPDPNIGGRPAGISPPPTASAPAPTPSPTPAASATKKAVAPRPPTTGNTNVVPF